MSVFRITRLMNNQIKSPNKSYFPKRRQSDDKNAVALVKIVPPLGCVSQDSGDHFDEYGSLSLRYVKRVSGKRKDHRLENYKSKFLISEVPNP